MAQSSEIKLLKRFDQNVEVTGTIKIGVREQTTAGNYVSDKITLVPPYHTGGPFNIRTRDDAGSAFISVAYGSTEVLTIKHDGTLNSNSNITIGGNPVLTSVPSEYLTQTEGDARYLQTLPSHSHNYIQKVSTLNSNYDFNDLYANDQLRFHSTYASNTSWAVSNVTNYPSTPSISEAYRYGSTLSLKNNGQGMFQIYAPHQQNGNSDMFYRTGWNTSYTDWARMWTDRNHGSGSGLDADLLDGLHSSSFIRNNGYANQTEYLILDNGSLNGPAIKVRYDGSTANRYIDFGYRDGFGNYSSGLKLYNNSNLTWLGNTVITSANIGGQSVGYATNAGSLDGIDSGSFLRSDANDTMNGTLTMNSTLLMNNYNIEGVNHIKFNDPGAGEGLEWVGGSGWKIYESGNGLDNTSGNLQFVTGSTRRMTLNTSGILEVFGDTIEINGKYARDFAHSRYISGGGSLYGSGTSGWAKVAQVTVTSNCSGAVLYGKMFSRAYHEAEMYNIAVVIRAECDFTSNNESHFIEFGCTTAASSERTNYRDVIRAVLVESSTNRRTYEVQFLETAWNDNWWELWSSGFTIYETPQTPGTATGTARINYRSRLGADDLYALNGAYAPTFYDRDNTSYYINPASTSNINDIDADHLNLGGASGDDGEDLKVGGIRGRFTNELIHLYNRVNIGYPSGWAGQDAPNYGLSVYGGVQLSTNDSYTTAGGSMRSPIFYDSDNTGYYVNPASTSNLGKVQITGTANGNDPTLKITSTTSNTFNHAVECFNSNLTSGEHNIVLFGKEGNTKNSGYIGYYWAGAGSNNNFVTIGHWGADDLFRVYPDQITGNSSFRAPIFYDSDNTNYYINPDSTSTVNVVNFAGYSSANGGFQVARNIGTISPSWQDANHTLSLQNTDAGYLSINFHRAGYTSNNIYYTGTEIIVDDTYRSTVDMRAPIFYDSNDTNYYINPNGVSNINELHGSGKEIFDATDDSYLRINQSNSFSSGCWFGSSNRLSGTTYIAAGSNGGTTSSRVYIYGGAYTGTNVIKIDGNTGIIQTTTDSMRAPVFYDYNNTSYYVDPASTSILEKLFIYEGTNGGGAQIRFSDHAAGSYAQYGTLEYVHADGSSYGSGNAFKFYGSEASMSFHVAGKGLFTGDIIAYYSDMRLKTKIGDIENPIDKIKALNGFYYEPNEKAIEYGYEKERRIGLSAQEVQEVVPEAVTMAAIGDNYLSVDYAKLVPVLVEAIKEQQKQIDELKKLINP